jgi:pimeloyl-ACP methyl ester carboxylesterase
VPGETARLSYMRMPPPHADRPISTTALYVIERGQANPGPVVVFVHGSLDRASSWVRTVRELRDLHTVRYDRRGYGRSRHLGSGVMDDHVADLLDVVAARAALVVGHSYGATVALVAAQRRPDVVRGVIAYEGIMSWRDWWPQPPVLTHGASAPERAHRGAEAAERFLRIMIGDEQWESLPSSVREQRRSEGEALLTELESARHGGAPYDPRRIHVPVISVRGTKSFTHLHRSADVLAKELPNAELAVIEGAAHPGHYTHPAEISVLVRRLIGRIRAQEL